MFSMNNKGVYVMDNAPDIQIFPVFDQSAPGVWYDFASIRTESAVVKYPSLATQESIAGYLEDCESSWKKKSFNFAYAAYHDDKMVGFIQGDVVDRVGYIRDLFVLPEYQKMRDSLLAFLIQTNFSKKQYFHSCFFGKHQFFVVLEHSNV